MSLLQDLSEVPDVGRIHILAHSMGAWLIMEALRERAIAGSPDLNGKLGMVMLAAPDIDFSVFREQLAKLDASHVSVLVSASDRALSLSRTLAGDRPRVGALDPRKPRTVPRSPASASKSMIFPASRPGSSATTLMPMRPTSCA